MTRTQYRTTVVRTEQLTPHLVRVVVGGDVVAEFPDNGCTDRYVKLMFPRPGVELPDDGTELWALPPEQRRSCGPTRSAPSTPSTTSSPSTS